MSDRHAVYAVLDTIHGPHKVRVSSFGSWDFAIEQHERLHGRAHKRDERGRLVPDSGYTRPVLFPGYEVYGRPVKFFAVRSIDDPTWPRYKAKLSVKDVGV